MIVSNCVTNNMHTYKEDEADLLTSAKVIKNGKMEKVIQNWV